MSRIADDHYIRNQQREQALEFLEYIVTAAQNYFQRKHGPLPARVDRVSSPSRKRNSPRKWSEHPVHGAQFAALNAQMSSARTHLKHLQNTSDSATYSVQIEALKNLISQKHREYDALRKAVIADESSH